MRTFWQQALPSLNRGFRRLGYELVRTRRVNNGYIDAVETISAAQVQGVSVREYVEAQWNQQGCTERVIEQMRKAGCLVLHERVLEIGPGTGRYLELVLQETRPRKYEIYETANDWAIWLARTYTPTVIRQPGDGHTLRQTSSRSCDLVHAHGVFVYLSLLHAFEYFAEMIRVCKPQGSIVFDFYPAERFDERIILRWLEHDDRYPVVLPAVHVQSFFTNRGCHLIHEFDNAHGHGQSHYFVFQLRNPVPGVLA